MKLGEHVVGIIITDSEISQQHIKKFRKYDLDVSNKMYSFSLVVKCGSLFREEHKL
jgi:hypothetical protein